MSTILETTTAAPVTQVPVTPTVAEERGCPIRVLHVYRRFHPDYTGDGIYYTRLIPHLEALGVRNEILAFETRTTDRLPFLDHQGIRINYLANQHDAAGRGSLLRWLARNIWRFDLVHLHSHVDRQFLSYGLARLCGRQVLYSCTLNDSPAQLLETYQPHNRWIAAALMRSIRTFVVISPHLFRLSLQAVERARIRFIPQGILLDLPGGEPANKNSAREALGLGLEDVILLNVGSVCRRKNAVFLVEALSRLQDPRAKLVIVGPTLEEDYEAEILALASRLGVRDRVLLAGFCDDTAPYYAAADAFVFASTAEGFPNVFLEALASGLPIVTLFLPGLTDFVVGHGETGFLAKDLDQFVEMLRTLAASPPLRARMGEAGRRFAKRNLNIKVVAEGYAALYRERPGGPWDEGRSGASRPDLRVRFCGELGAGPTALSLKEIDTPPDWAPMLQVVIDTEADFDWDKGTTTDTGRTLSIIELERFIDILLARGIKPALVIDHPVATQRESRKIVRRLADKGCEVGVHLHSWSTPPFVEPKDDWHSFSGNLGPQLERLKLVALSEQVADLTGAPPRIFKAGRYGLGANTLAALEELSFEIDLSICPHYDFGSIGGPDFSRFNSRPAWMGSSGQVLALPTTAAPLGWLGGVSERVPGVLRSPLARWLRLDRIAARSRAFYPMRLSPEGASRAQMRAVARRLYSSGLRVFTLSLHSPSLQVGNTPYVRSSEDLRALQGSVNDFLDFFHSEMGGVFTTPTSLHARLSALRGGC